MVKRGALILSLIVGLLVAFVSGYFTLWRPSNADIRKTLNNIDKARALSNDVLPKSLKSLSQPKNISTQEIKQFQKDVTSFTDVVSAIDRSSTMNNAIFMNSVYKKKRGILLTYSGSLSTLSKSLEIYGKLQTACNLVAQKINIVKTKSDFDSLANACEKAASSASSPNSAFNGGFYTNYREKVRGALLAAREFFTTRDASDFENIKARLESLNKANLALKESLSVTINYDLPPIESDVFTDIASSIKESQSSLIR